jgi:arylamine N-acetyltransferase
VLDRALTAKAAEGTSKPDIDLAAYFARDVGFGGQTPSSPIQLTAGPIQRTRHEPYRLRVHQQGYVLESSVRDIWQPLYTFTTEPRPMIDLTVGSWYVSTYPASKFVVSLNAALVTDDARLNLRGRNLDVHFGGETERIRFDTAPEVLDTLVDRFGINVSGLGDVEAREAAVLDS